MRIRLLIGMFMTAGLVAAASSHREQRPLHAYPDAPGHSHRDSGAIEGQVLNAEGRAVYNAEVLAQKMNFTGKLPAAYTDEQGMFLIKNLAPGSYMISVSKIEDDYPPTHLPFYCAGLVEVPEVTVYEGHTTSGIAVNIGAKAAKVVGRVVDATTNKLLRGQGVAVTFRRGDNFDYSYKAEPDVDGRLTTLLPPVPLTIEVSAPGYETKALGALHMRRGETKRLDIPLRSAK